uniref:Uncharacterized protein n=1 Tax=Aegilops tauschii subsp. strangulata TaxID=200361 RepID=A0A453S0Y6_AEGTS
ARLRPTPRSLIISLSQVPSVHTSPVSPPFSATTPPPPPPRLLQERTSSSKSATRCSRAWLARSIVCWSGEENGGGHNAGGSGDAAPPRRMLVCQDVHAARAGGAMLRWLLSGSWISR